MAKAKIPSRLQPKETEVAVEDPQVSTDLTVSRTYEPEQISSLQSLGLIKVDGERFKSIGELGKAAKSIGLIHLIHGGYMVSVENILQAIGAAGSIVRGERDAEGNLPSTKDKQEAAKIIGYLSGQLAKVNGAVTKVEQTRVQVIKEVDRQRRASFQPGVLIPVPSGQTPDKQ